MNSLLQVTTTPVSSNGEEHTGLIGLIILIITVGLVFWACWPSLRENNIFQKVRLYNYGRGEAAKAYVRHRQRDTLVFCIVANIAGFALLINQNIQIREQGLNYHLSPMDRLPLRFFLLSLFCTVCLFVFSLVGEVDMDLIRNFKFSLKIWITSIFVSPLIWVILNSYKFPTAGYMFYVYTKSVVTISGIGSLTFAALVFSVHYFTAKHLKISGKRLSILLTTQVVMLLNMGIAAVLIRPSINWFTGWLIFTLTIVWCIKYYDLDATVYSDETYYAAEVLDGTEEVNFEPEDKAHSLNIEEHHQHSAE